MILETPNFFCVKVDVGPCGTKDGVSIFYGPNGLRIKARTGEQSGFTKTFNIMPHEVQVDSIFATWNCRVVTVIMRKSEKKLTSEKIIELS